jgi:hypothetical protein
MATDRFARWRLVLGRQAEEGLSRLAGRASALEGDDAGMDEALEQIYGAATGPASKERGSGLGKSAPRLTKWLGDIRGYFSKDVVAIIQKDAIDKKGLKQLLFEPETLGQVTPDVELVGTLLSLQKHIPDRAKEAARAMVRTVVEEIVKRLRGGLEQAVRGSLDRSRHSPMRSLPNMDWLRTIRRNLKNYDRQHKVLVPESFHFFARQQRRREWNVIVCMDQSGSMASSVVHGGITGAILASMPALETHVVVFDTEVVDLTAKCHDPVDLLFGIQLGGGTDINRAVKYCQGLIHDPAKTLLLLITDLYEGGNGRELVRRMEELVQGGVRALCLLSLSDEGVPTFDHAMAHRFADVGVPSFACTPKMLPSVLEGALKGVDLFRLADMGRG